MPRPWPTTPPTTQEQAAYGDAVVRSFWVDDLPARATAPPLAGAPLTTSLCIVGGGFTGLWAALQAKADDPAREVVLLRRAGSATLPAVATAASA